LLFKVLLATTSIIQNQAQYFGIMVVLVEVINHRIIIKSKQEPFWELSRFEYFDSSKNALHDFIGGHWWCVHGAQEHTTWLCQRDCWYASLMHIPAADTGKHNNSNL
jgi:hypothetical protein